MTKNDHFDFIIVGSGFAATFFLQRILEKSKADVRVLVLEKGNRHSYDWKLKSRRNSNISSESTFINKTPQKPWIQNIAFGGGACWVGNTPRPHASDFSLKSSYGISEDWPFGYDYLEPYLTQTEYIMGIAGAESTLFQRSRPYPATAHTLNAFDHLLKNKYPDHYLPMPSARSSEIKTGRPTCCANSVCSTCPITSKFQVDLHMRQWYEDPRVTLRTQSDVQRLDITGGTVTGVYYKSLDGEDHLVTCDFAAVAAHAIATPFILLKSGLQDKALGHYLNEQFSVDVRVNLQGIDNYDGSQAVTGLGLMFHDGEFRTERPGCYLESWNTPWLRAEKGKWRQRAFFKLVFEDIPKYDNYVSLSAMGQRKPEVSFADTSDYVKKGMDVAPELVETLLEGLPVEDFEIEEKGQGLSSEAHIQGTCRMGDDPETSVVDKHLIHHKVRNLAVLGSGSFPTCPAANPTLILSALSLMAADHI